jgi:phosphate-selective porin OprO/OprP
MRPVFRRVVGGRHGRRWLTGFGSILAAGGLAVGQTPPAIPVAPPIIIPDQPVAGPAGPVSPVAPPLTLPAVFPDSAPFTVLQPSDPLRPPPGYVSPPPGTRLKIEGPPVAGVTPSATPSVANPAPASEPPKFESVWNSGLFQQTANKNFVLHLGATVQYDGAWYSAQDSLQLFPGGLGRFNDGVNLRRGRIRAEGTMYQNTDFLFELEFFNGVIPAGLPGPATFASVTNSPGPTDAWVTLKKVPVVGNVRIGSQKEWFSLEHLNSYRYLEFMERSYLFDASQATAFNNGFTPGISVFRTWASDRVFTAIGVYKNESDLLGFGLGDGQYATTGRVTALPIYRPDEQFYWHVGGSMSYRDPVNSQVQVRVRDTIRNAPFPLLNLVANTGLVNASSQTLFNLETAAVRGPVTLQAEYLANLINSAQVGAGPNMGTARLQGAYVTGLVFLTGESRSWDTNTMTFKRVIPKRNFLVWDADCGVCNEGWGAWELGARYSYLDLDDKAVRGGHLNSVTLGLNWYWNPNAKLQFNYDYMYREGGPNPIAKGSVHAFGTRLAYDF